MVWYGMGTVLLSSLRLFFVSFRFVSFRFVSFRFVCDCFLCIPGVSSSCSSSTVCMYAVFGLCLCVLLFVLRVVLLACLSECRISKNHHS
jgi:hypothetical protein